MGELDFAKEHPNASEYVKAGFYSMETNWYSKLSGGQRSKAELISQVFLRQKCPEVLLIDEALAPLDADSKMLVQQKLKSFCNESVLLVIHHLDSHSQCVSGGFFDDNLHFEHGEASLMGTCQEQDVFKSAGGSPQKREEFGSLILEKKTLNMYPQPFFW